MAAEDYFDLDGYDLYDSGNPDGPTNIQEEWEENHHCEGKPILRTNSFTNEKFIGCDKFPACRHTIPFRGEMPE